MYPLLGTLTWNFGTFWKLHLTWNFWNLSEPYLGTHFWRVGTSWNLSAEHFLGTLEPSENLPLLEPFSGTLTWNLGTTWNFGTSCGSFTWNPSLEPGNLLEPLYPETRLETSEPSRTLTWNPCGMTARLPQSASGPIWLRPQSFQLLGKKTQTQTHPADHKSIAKV